MVRSALYSLRRSNFAMWGIILVFLIVFFSVAIPFFLKSPFSMTKDAFYPPNKLKLFGTDDLGRDMLARTANGARISLFVGFIAAFISALIGVIIGSLAGFFGGYIDELLARVIEGFQVIPQFFFAILIVALFGPSIGRIIMVIGVLSWPSTARIVRVEFFKTRDLEFVTAARLSGVKNSMLIFKEILPNVLPLVVVNTSLQIAKAIITESSLSFLGLGDQNIISLGQLLYNARPFIQEAWWLMVFPGIVLSIIGLGFNLLGDGLNDILNPRKQ